MISSSCVSHLGPNVVPAQVEAVSVEESSEARGKLESSAFWIPQAGRHKAWLTALCTILLDSGGVKNEALLLSRPLCLVSACKSHQPTSSLHLSTLKVLFAHTIP